MRKYEYVIIRNDKEIGINEYGFDYLINLEKVLDEIREYIKEHISYEKNSDGYAEPYLSGYAIKGTLEILDKVGSNE